MWVLIVEIKIRIFLFTEIILILILSAYTEICDKTTLVSNNQLTLKMNLRKKHKRYKLFFDLLKNNSNKLD